MPSTLTLVRIGRGVGVVLPDDLLAQLGAQAGDTLTFTDCEGGVLLQRTPTEDRQLAVAREVMARRRKALRDLSR